MSAIVSDMKTITLRSLRRSAALLDGAAAGEDLLVTRFGRPYVRIVAADKPASFIGPERIWVPRRRSLPLLFASPNGKGYAEIPARYRTLDQRGPAAGLHSEPNPRTDRVRRAKRTVRHQSDRTIVATAAVMGLTLITADRVIRKAEQCAVEYYHSRQI